MTRSNRLILLGLAAVVLIVAAAAIGTHGDDKTKSASNRGAAPSAVSTTDGSGSANASEPAASPTPEPVIRITVRAGQPVGGIKEIEVDKGDDVRFDVISDETENVHLHGYDVEKAVGPNTPAMFDFKAKIDGIFEVELEGSAVQIVSLRVNP